MGRPKNKYPTDSKLYRIRVRMLISCLNSKNPHFKYFGAKGISVCEEWVNSYEDFYLWANSNGYEDGLTILRRDENKDFTPDNCFFGKYERTTHGMSKSRIYHIRREMIHRCHNEKSSSYKNYGAKGIKVCKEWRENFENFWEWASSNGYSDELTIDRINPKLGYSPENCRWITMHEQILNQDRNKNRTAEEKYIRKLDDGRYRLHIAKRTKGKSQQLLAQTLETIDEAIKARDYFLKYGEKIDMKKLDEEITSLTASPEERKIKMLKRKKELRKEKRKYKVYERKQVA